MTRSANARLAGWTFLFYIAAGITGLAATGDPHVTAVTGVLTSFAAVVLGVTLYAITRDQDADLALLAMACRIVEAIPGEGRLNAIFFTAGSTLFSLLLLRGRMIPRALAWLGVIVSPLLGVILILQRAGLPVPATGWGSALTWLLWLPMLVFEVALALWLLIKGVGPAPDDATPLVRGAA
jgi:hypothetical protein